MNKVTKRYKDSLSQKTVDELVEIILRKDDKEREKNKLISNLERKIHEFKTFSAFDEQKITDQMKAIRDIRTEALRLATERDNLETSYDFCRKQNTVLRLLASTFGAVVIIETLMLIFS